MAKPESKTEFFYNEKGLIAIGSPVKLQILNLLREEPRSFDEIVKSTAKAKSTISVHLNNLRSCELVEENYDPERSPPKNLFPYFSLHGLLSGTFHRALQEFAGKGSRKRKRQVLLYRNPIPCTLLWL